MIERLQYQHIPAAKAVADANKHELGFLMRNKFTTHADSGMGFVANQGATGFVLYYHRKRDTQTTLYDLCVARPERGNGWGRQLLQAVVAECQAMGRQSLLLKCPVDLAANKFYAAMGMELSQTLAGKSRALNVWVYRWK